MRKSQPHTLHLLHQPVQSLVFGADDAGVDERFDLGPPGLGGASEVVHLIDAGGRAPDVDDVELCADDVARGAGAGQGEQVAKLFFPSKVARICPNGLESISEFQVARMFSGAASAGL